VLTVSVVETGNIGVDLDVAAAQVKAIKEALGPAIAEGVKTRLTPAE
jgi:hypothetical protein